jgi:hypothetical protein
LNNKSGQATRKILLQFMLMADIKQPKKKKKKKKKKKTKKTSTLIHQVRTDEYLAKPAASLMGWPSRKW